jgi:hypothetical protein
MAGWIDRILNRGEQIPRFVWLLKISYRSQFAGLLAVTRLLARGNKNNRDGRAELGLNLLGYRKALPPGRQTSNKTKSGKFLTAALTPVKAS